MLQVLDNGAQEFCAVVAVADAVISGQRDLGGAPRLDLAINDDWLQARCPDADNRHLRRKNHTGDARDTAVAQAGQGNRWIGQFARPKTPLAHTGHKVFEPRHQRVQIAVRSIVKGRGHKPATAQIDRHTQMYGIAGDESAILEIPARRGAGRRYER